MVSKAERAASAASRTAGRGVGAGIGAAFSSPAGFGLIAVIGIIAILFIFRDRISEAFSNFGKIEFPDFPTIEFPDFPDINIDFPDFPELPNLCTLFGIGCPDGNGEPEPVGDLPFPMDVEDTGLLTEQQREECKCGTNIIQDIQGDVSEICIQCPDTFIPPDQPTFETPAGIDIGPFLNGDAGFIGPPEPDTPPIPEPFTPPVELPSGFIGGGPSFEGGTIFQTDICNKSIGQIAQENGISASAAADMKFQACEVSDFEFGTNTGSGFGPLDDPATGSIVTGGATLESEEQKAACVTCEMFGLNCPLCAGTI